jgi:hypothetical protein
MYDAMESRFFVALVLLASCATATSPPSPSARVENVWTGATVDVERLPLGDKRVSTAAPAQGQLYACPSGAAPPPVGASAAGPWLDLVAGTWNLSQKVSVSGLVSWPAAEYGEAVERATRTLVTNGLPTRTVTGIFPIRPEEPAYRYDRNPNAIAAAALRYVLPVTPAEATAPACLPMGPIGLLRNGVAIFAPVDEAGRDAVAWETQDTCQGHPEQRGEYHYHHVSACLQNAAQGPSTVVGWAADGYPIVVERDAQGRLPTNADLDVCHGRTSKVLLGDAIVTSYHYSATAEFPYVMGCFHGRPVAATR